MLDGVIDRGEVQARNVDTRRDSLRGSPGHYVWATVLIGLVCSSAVYWRRIAVAIR